MTRGEKKDVTDQERTNGKRTRTRRRTTGDSALGLRVRKARLRAGLSQECAAHQVERSDRWLLQVENGQTDPTYGDLVRLAPVLRVDLHQLVLEEEPARVTTPRTSMEAPSDPGPPAVRRRRFLQASLVATGGIMLGMWPAPDDASSASDMAALRRTLLSYESAASGELPALAALRDEIRAARTDLQASRYSSVLRTIPSLLMRSRLVARELSGSEQITAHGLLAQTHRLIFNILRKRGDSYLATIAADRGMQAAHASGDPGLVADLAGCLCVVLSDSHQFDQAIDLCTATAPQLLADGMRGDPSLLSIHGQLLLAGAEAAAQGEDRHVSDEFYAEATALARRLGRDANHSFTAFGPTNITVHRVHAAVVLDDGERALRLAREVDVRRLPVVERRAHHLMDVAIGHALMDKSTTALSTLLEAERIAPEEVRFDLGARALVAELTRRGGQHGKQIEELAGRMFGTA